MPQCLDFPFIRLLFVCVLTFVLVLLLQLKLLTTAIANINFTELATKPMIAIFVGLIAGIGEKAVTVQVVERIRGIVVRGSITSSRSSSA